jgi:hypothetical protein
MESATTTSVYAPDQKQPLIEFENWATDFMTRNGFDDKILCTVFGEII